MDIDSQTQMLQEMGFLRDQALEALRASGNDLNKAIAYLFGEVDASSGNGTQMAPFDVEKTQPNTGDSIEITNPQEIPEFFGLYPSNSPMEDVRHYERPVAGEKIALSSESLVSREENLAENFGEGRLPAYSSGSSSSLLQGALLDSFIEEQEEDVEEVEYPENIKTDFTNVPFILSRQRDSRCWVPLLLILAHSSIFARPILTLESDLRFVKEVQRIVYFVQNFPSSKRWYVDSENLTHLLQEEGPRSSYQDEEIVLNMIDFLMRKEPSLRPIFESMVESLDEDINKELTVLEIDADSRASSLYETLNELFWQREFEFLGKIKYSSVAPIVTYQLVADLAATCVPFHLQEVIYPELYSDKALGHIQEEIHAIKRAQMDYQTLNRKLMDLNFFEGKKIDGLLLQTAAALKENNPGASEDIQALAETLQGTRLRELEAQTRAKNDASPHRLALFEGVIAKTPDLRPYKLLGVIFSESRYFVRAADAWIDMEAGVTVDFESVKNTVAHNAGPYNITLVYGDAQANEPLTLVVPDPETKSDLETGENSESHVTSPPHKSENLTNACESSLVSTGSSETPSEESEELIKVNDSSPSTAPTKVIADATASTLAATHDGVSSQEKNIEGDGEENAQKGNEVVKRARWADVGPESNPHPEKVSVQPPFPKSVRVNPLVVQRYLQDEESAQC